MSDVNPHKVAAIARESSVVFYLDRDFWDLVLSWNESKAINIIEKESQTGGEVSPKVNYLDEALDWMSNLLNSPLFAKIPAVNIQKLFSLFEEKKNE